MSRDKKYEGSGVSSDVKEFAAEFAYALKMRGVSIDVIWDAMTDTDYAPSKSTLYNLLAKVEGNTVLFKRVKESGRPRLMDQDNFAIVCGWILMHKEKVNFESTIKWIDEIFGIRMSKSILSRYLKEFGLSTQLTGKRANKAVDFKHYCEGYLAYVLELRALRFFDGNMSKLIAFDFITNSYRTDR
jgi:transposase